jgi:hypothetical protein
MAKYGKVGRQTAPPPRPWDIHPIWRGIGCILFLVGPIIAFAAAHILVDTIIEQNWIAVPYEMSGTIVLPFVNYPIHHFFADLLVAALLLLLGFALIMIVYSVIYGFLGPSRYGPLDSPPIRRKPLRRK